MILMSDDPNKKIISVKFSPSDMSQIVQTQRGQKTLLQIHAELKQAYVFDTFGLTVKQLILLPDFVDSKGNPIVSAGTARRWIREGGWDEERKLELAEAESEFRQKARLWRIESQMERLRDMRTVFQHARDRVLTEEPEIKSAEGAWNALAALAKTVEDLEKVTLDPIGAEPADADSGAVTHALSSDDLAAVSRLFVERKAAAQAARVANSRSLPESEADPDDASS
jgi:hypothetical protein